MEDKKKIVLIIGAGVAGLSAAYSLIKNSNEFKPIVIECDKSVGGLAKSYVFDGMKFDIGPHRYFSKEEKVMSFWGDFFPYQGKPAKDDVMLGRWVLKPRGTADPKIDDNIMLQRQRFSRIYYKNKFYDYPVKLNLLTVLNMGIFQTIKCGFSYIKSCFFKRKENNLEDYMINRFGHVLYETFFEFYTQKVWGKHPKDISKEWGEQRIKGLSLLKTILNKLLKKKDTSLIEKYYYPKLGSGQLWEEMAKYIKENGGEVWLETKVTGLKVENGSIVSLNIHSDGYGDNEIKCDYVFSSMPVIELIFQMNNVPDYIKNIAKGLPYRDFQLISYKVNNFNLKNNTEFATIDNICPDSCIYIQDREVKMGRIYIPKNFSPYLLEDIHDTLISLEYFCDKGDELWELSDNDIFEFGISELKKINAINSDEDIISSHRLKIEKAYPAYFDSYKDFDKIKGFINSIANLYCIGRNGQHKYNNMDHSTLSGIRAAEILINGENKSLLWDINTEQTYQETR